MAKFLFVYFMSFVVIYTAGFIFIDTNKAKNQTQNDNLWPFIAVCLSLAVGSVIFFGFLR